MNTRAIVRLISVVMIFLGLAIAACWGVSIVEEDPARARAALWQSSAVLMALGLLAFLLSTRNLLARILPLRKQNGNGQAVRPRRARDDFSRRDGFAIVTFGWLAAALFGSLPYLLSGVITSPITAVFETMSGFTTTGASALDNLESVPRGIMFWRCMTQWFGGMGVLVLVVAILPFLGIGGMQIYRAEMPGPTKDRLTPRITSTAKLLWGIYVGLSLVEALSLHLAGMTWYDACCHTFTTMSTGGFSTRTASVAAFDSLAIELILIAFMLLAGINFSLHFRAVTGRPMGYFRDPEFRFYVASWLGASLFLAWSTHPTHFAGFGEALRAGLFQGTSIMTTTGYVTEDFDQWPGGARLLLVVLMFGGGCAGSTAGGMKLVRVFIVLKQAIREVQLFMRPKAIITLKLGKQALDRNIVSHIMAFFVLFVLTFGVATMVMTQFTPDLETAATSVVATLANIGPGLGGVGAVQNYASIPDAGKAVLTVCMLLGRLELYTVLVLLLPGFWKK